MKRNRRRKKKKYNNNNDYDYGNDDEHNDYENKDNISTLRNLILFNITTLRTSRQNSNDTR